MEALQKSEIPRLGKDLLESLQKTTIKDLNEMYTNGKFFYRVYKKGNSYLKNRKRFLSEAGMLREKTIKLAGGVLKTEISSKINSIYSILIRQGQQLGALQQINLSLSKVEAYMNAYNMLLELMKILIDNARL